MVHHITLERVICSIQCILNNKHPKYIIALSHEHRLDMFDAKNGLLNKEKGITYLFDLEDETTKRKGHKFDFYVGTAQKRVVGMS